MMYEVWVSDCDENSADYGRCRLWAEFKTRTEAGKYADDLRRLELPEGQKVSVFLNFGAA